MYMDEMENLFKIANCGITTTYPIETRYREVKPHWWSRKTVKQPYAFTPEPAYYRLHEALSAIKALGETGSEKALDFLKDLYTVSTESEYDEYFVSGGSEPRDDDWMYSVTTYAVYPRAHGDLMDALKFDIGYDTGYRDYDDGSEQEVRDYGERIKRSELESSSLGEAHETIRDAIRKLKSVLEK